MSLEKTLYHSVLRVSLVVCAVMLVFQSGLIHDSTTAISGGTSAYLANAVGMSASIQPNGINEYTAALTQKERELAAREAALAERELSVSVSGGAASDSATYLLASVLFILLVLIVLNYTLDFIRAREQAMAEAV